MHERILTREPRAAKQSKRRELGWRARLLEAQDQNWERTREYGDQIRFHLSERATY
jgi:hypothetical protein